jgi:hypothetical protein
MANARKQVKKISNVGRAGKAGKEAQLVRIHTMDSYILLVLGITERNLEL